MCGRVDCILIETVGERRILVGRISREEGGILDGADRLTRADVDAQPNVFGHNADVDGQTLRRLLLCCARLWALHCVGERWLA